MAIGTSKPAQACPAISERAYLVAVGGRVAPSTAYLAAARQARLWAGAWPDYASTYKAHCRYWLALAGVARRREGRRLP